ncbi:hypothetical protein, conserved [Babesia ovata]|uniref:C3H1-type domain-containing protein n=1 Tax=Babesia ovata TaxID=189622 RepID=A0A2H6KKI6_9APIC|nr:uncharacterized protein BOVATA_049930 [Babesia ovata]GBE63500.1 hypothetical protein, conserved [Babesia ovata]
MAFLGGVLHSIQPKLGQHKGEINNALSTLKSTNLNGITKYKAAVAVVASGVRTYNVRVAASNESVKSVITTLQGQVNENFKKAVSFILNDNGVSGAPTNYSDKDVTEAERQINDKLQQCQQNATTFITNLDISNTSRSPHKESITDLNAKLKDTLENVRRTVEYESARLEGVKVQEEKVFENTKRQITDVLSNLNVRVDCSISEQVKLLVSKLKGKVDPILADLKGIDSKFAKNVFELEQWIANAEAAVKAALEKVEAVINEVDETKRKAKNKQEIETAAEFIRGLSSTLNDDFALKNEQFRKAVEAIKSATEQLNQLHTSVKGEVTDKLGQIQQHLDVKDTELKGKIKGEMKTYVEDIVFKNIRREVEKIKNGVQKDNGRSGVNGNSIEKRWEELKEQIMQLVGEINGPGITDDAEPVDKYRGIKGIREKVKEFANSFNKRNFEAVVKGWIRMILDKDEVVKKAISAYVSASEPNAFNTAYINESNKVIEEEGIKQIAHEIKEKLKNDVITKAVAAFETVQSSSTDNEITKSIRAVMKACDEFADKLNAELENDTYSSSGVNSFVWGIIEAVDKKVENGGNSGKAGKHMLRGVVLSILPALQSSARRTAKTLERFTSDTKGQNLGFNLGSSVEAAINSVIAIGNEFDVSDRTGKGYGKRLNDALAAVKKQIDELHNNLDTAPQRSRSTGPKNILGEDISASIATNVKWATVDPQLGKLLKDTADAGIQKFHEKLQQEVVEKILDPVDKEVTKHEQSANKAYTDIIQRVNEITGGLFQMCNAIKQAASSDPQSAKAKLTELRDTYFKHYEKSKKDANESIKKIHSQLSELRNELASKPLQSTEKLLSFIDTAAGQVTREMQRQVNTQVKQATDQLTTHARRQYVEALKFALRQFADKVTEELSELPGEIENDKHIGLKGFMEAFYGANSGDNINKLQDGIDLRTVCHGFEKFLGPLNTYMNSEIDRLKEEEHKKNPTLQKPQDPYSKQLNNVYSKLSTVIGHIMSNNYYDHNLPTKLAELTATVADLKLDGFPNPVTGMLGGISGGCRQLVDVLGDVYISKYDGLTIKWEKDEKTNQNCAKAFLTILPTIFHGLHWLFYNGGNKWQDYKVAGSANGDRKADELKTYLTDAGYDIQHLRKSLTGMGVTGKLYKGFHRLGEFNKPPKDFDSIEECTQYFKKHEGLLSRLFDHLHAYYNVCHLPTSHTKHPTSVYQMLTWLNGLPHNPVYDALSFDGFNGLFEKPKQAQPETQGDDPTVEVLDDLSLPAHPNPITPASLSNALTEVCSQAEDVLLSILGYGHDDGIYAVDFNTNECKLDYPGNPGQCLDLLLDILRRVFYQLRFLYQQCSNTTKLGGWKDCVYGQQIGNSGWQCNSIQCPNQECKLKADQKGGQKANQKCNQHPQCGVKSPLQSFLEDGLQGFLPHTFSKPGCKLTCTVKNHHGIPCVTPMGFTECSIVASHTSKGSRLYLALKEFCGTASSPLTKLCTQLNCLLPTAPKTLGDMFSFYYNFINNWAGSGREHRLDAFNTAVTNANFQNEYVDLDPTAIIGKFGHVHSREKADLCSLVCTEKSATTCGPYLQSLNNDITVAFASKHAANYLSWIVYATETFYDLLKKLYDDCCGTCGGDTPKCRVARGQHTCNVANQQSSDNDSDTCNSIVKCQHTRPTIYKYGFVHHDVVSLAGQTRRTCKDFCNALNKVLNKEEKIGARLAELIYRTIPEFLFRIREPFIWTLVALWSLSLLYLLHITVVRLDVLRIRSHLRSPSSHRIAAQSLLAAARVKALANVKYFSP